jgi:hypothetical protein
MIDPLLSATMPLPARTGPNDVPPGTPSFLPWALGVAAQGGQGDALAQQGNQDPQQDTVADLSALIESTAATLEAAQLNGRLSSVVEFHVRNPQGERELIASPWRLMATGRLAQSIGAREFVDATISTSTYDPIVSAQIATAQPALVASHFGSAVLRSDAVGSTMPASLTVSMHAAEGDELTPLPSLPSSSPAAVEWLARWMKWIERDGHDPMVLLRDFRIDDDEAQRIVDGLRAFAQEHGVGLDRIVVNGREFWRRPDLSQAQE